MYHDFVKKHRNWWNRSHDCSKGVGLAKFALKCKAIVSGPSFRVYTIFISIFLQNVPLSLVQEPKIKLSMITEITSDEYFVDFKIKKDNFRKIPSTLAEETSQNNNKTCSKRFDSAVVTNIQSNWGHHHWIFWNGIWIGEKQWLFICESICLSYWTH